MNKLFNKLSMLFGIFSILYISSSCSVVMAARKTGTDITQVQSAKTRARILSLGAKVINSERDYWGNLTEIYNIPKEKGSTARAVMHGVLDISTWGLWEIVGTPMEAVLTQEEYFSVRVYYDRNDNVKLLELI